MSAGSPPVRRGIQTRLAVLVLVAAIVPALVFGGFTLQSLSATRRAILAERRALVETASRHVESEVRGMLEALASLGSQPEALRSAQLRSRLLSGAMLVDADGRIEGGGGLSRCLDVHDVIRIGKPAVCVPSGAAPAARRLLVVPLRDTAGRTARAAIGVIDLTDGAWTGLLPAKALPASAAIRLVDEGGALLAGRDATVGPTDIVVSRRLTVLPWTVAVSQPSGDAFAPVRALERRWVVVTPFLAALTVLFAWGVARSVKAPLAKLEQAAAQIAAGDLTRPLPPLGRDEIGRLGASFESMRQALAREEPRRLLLRRVIGAQEEERKRIARELHDDTCQMITAINLKLASAGIKDAEAMAGRALDELHRIIYDLRPSILDDLGLLPAIRWVATRDLVPLGVQVRCELEEPAPKVPFEVEIAVFRAVQEAINNIIRHARAETVLVEVVRNGSALEVVIEDDGVGFDVGEAAAPAASGRGLGILGMHERMALIGGDAKVTSAPGKGTRVTLRVPLTATEA